MAKKVISFKMRNKYNITVLFLIFLVGCSQYKLDFDLNEQALMSCDERIIIKNVNIMEADNNDEVYQIHIKDNFEGSNIVYLTRRNNGYDTGPNSIPELKPNKEYIITSAQGDSRLEMRVFTDSSGKIDSVSNNFNCKN